MPENPHAAHIQELLQDLNEPQREAVTHGEGPLLILAGAGSGKTRVLAHRIAFLIYTHQFTIYDQADARRLTKRSADAVGVDPKRFTPAAIHNQISAAKNQLIDAASYRQAVGSQFEEMIADVYDIYERDLHRMNAMDFDDLLFRTVNLLELFEDVRERYRDTFRHVLVDEYQDTNHAQYRMLQLLVGGGRPPQRGGSEPG